MVSQSYTTRARTTGQKDRLPALYGAIDFTRAPERFAAGVTDQTSLSDRRRREELLARQDLMETIAAYTLQGDEPADAYAALLPQFGFRRLVDMLVEACEVGAQAVADAPPELKALMADLERKPEWLEMAMVEEGARADRNFTANVLPYIMQVGFVGTFMNKYTALPMAMTGTLSHATARRRVLETSIFMVTTSLPHALDRGGPGFKACAMVRLMHSMVRVNVLTSGKWDGATYGVPIPQVDQMPAGLALVYFMSKDVLKSRRTTFTRRERARVEHSRYRCYLLGLPEELLPTTPQGIVDIMEARHATIRDGYDEAICGSLVRATMAANLAADESWRSRMRQSFSISFGKLFFLREYARGDRTRARHFGVEFSLADYVRIAIMASVIALRTASHAICDRLPGVRNLSNTLLVFRMHAMLRRYGHADFISDASSYRPTAKVAA